MAYISQNLVRVDGRYYYRQRIPVDLLFASKGKEIKKALGTACPKAAKIKAITFRGLVETYFNDLRKLTDNKDVELDEFGLSPEDHARDNEILANGGKFGDTKAGQIASRKLNKAIIDGLAQEVRYQEVQGALKEMYLEAEKGKLKKQKEELEQQKAQLQNNVNSLIVQNTTTTEALSKVLEHGVAQTPKEPEKAVKRYSECIEMALLDTAVNKKPTEHSLNQKRSRMEFFLRVCEDKPITDYTREDILKYKSQIEELPKTFMKSPKDATRSLEDICRRPEDKMSQTTLKKHYNEVKSVFKAASREFPVNLGILDNVVLHGVAAKKRKVWTTQHINDLLKTPIYMGRKGRHRTSTFLSGTRFYKDAYFWMPILALYTGMRREEIAKLRVCDFKEEDGIPYIDVNEEFGRLKNKQSARKVPIHPDLYKYGLKDLVKGRQNERIFHELKLGGPEKNKWGFEYSEDFTEYRKETGIYEELRDFHSFRHTFASALYDATKDVLTVCGICGHSAEEANDLGDMKGIKVTTTNYIHRDLKASYEAIKQLKYEGVDFSNLLKDGKR